MADLQSALLMEVLAKAQRQMRRHLIGFDEAIELVDCLTIQDHSRMRVRRDVAKEREDVRPYQRAANHKDAYYSRLDM